MPGTVKNALAQYLNKIFQSYINSTYSIRFCDELLVHLSQLHLQPGHQLLSLDSESLFTSVPVEDSINIILEEAYNHPIQPQPDFQLNNLQELFKICTKQTHLISMVTHLYKLQTMGYVPSGALICLFLYDPFRKQTFIPRMIGNQSHFYRKICT